MSFFPTGDTTTFVEPAATQTMATYPLVAPYEHRHPTSSQRAQPQHNSLQPTGPLPTYQAVPTWQIPAYLQTAQNTTASFSTAEQIITTGYGLASQMQNENFATDLFPLTKATAADQTSPWNYDVAYPPHRQYGADPHPLPRMPIAYQQASAPGISTAYQQASPPGISTAYQKASPQNHNICHSLQRQTPAYSVPTPGFSTIWTMATKELEVSGAKKTTKGGMIIHESNCMRGPCRGGCVKRAALERRGERVAKTKSKGRKRSGMIHEDNH